MSSQSQRKLSHNKTQKALSIEEFTNKLDDKIKNLGSSKNILRERKGKAQCE